MNAHDKVIELRRSYGEQVINSNESLIKCYLHQQLNLTVEQVKKLKDLEFAFETLTRVRREMTERQELKHPSEVVERREELEQKYKYKNYL